ncbi:MAG: DUF1858 domain-containing protein [Nanoarchaeota archaeon]|nr:DUF1858 domain-containing protein [Nanoarchaeota archaeon]
MVKKTDKIGDVLKKYPEAAMILLEAGLGCVGCPMMSQETIEQGCKAHGLSNEEIDELIKKINKKIGEKNG